MAPAPLPWSIARAPIGEVAPDVRTKVFEECSVLLARRYDASVGEARERRYDVGEGRHGNPSCVANAPARCGSQLRVEPPNELEAERRVRRFFFRNARHHRAHVRISGARRGLRCDGRAMELVHASFDRVFDRDRFERAWRGG